MHRLLWRGPDVCILSLNSTQHRKDKRKCTAYLQSKFGSKSLQHAPFSRETSLLIPTETDYNPAANPSEARVPKTHLILCAAPTANGYRGPAVCRSAARHPGRPRRLQCPARARRAARKDPRRGGAARSEVGAGAWTEVPEAVLSWALWVHGQCSRRGEQEHKRVWKKCAAQPQSLYHSGHTGNNSPTQASSPNGSSALRPAAFFLLLLPTQEVAAVTAAAAHKSHLGSSCNRGDAEPGPLPSKAGTLGAEAEHQPGPSDRAGLRATEATISERWPPPSVPQVLSPPA